MSIYILADIIIAACDWLAARNLEFPTGGMVIAAMNAHFPGGWDSFVDDFKPYA